MQMPIDVKQIPSIPDALISKDGRIWRNGIEKKVFIAANGYKCCTFSIKNKSIQKALHRLLLETFVGPCPEKHETLHINGNKLDNRLENLRYGTRKENVADAIRHGTATIGINNGAAKFVKETLNEVIQLKSQNFTNQQIADYFKVNKATIERILSGRTYKRGI